MGFTISDFWDTTPKEFCIIVDGYVDRKNQEEELMISQAYMISRWVWAKKLNLEEILNKSKPSKEMSDDQMMKMCKALNKLYGGKEVIENGN